MDETSAVFNSLATFTQLTNAASEVVEDFLMVPTVVSFGISYCHAPLLKDGNLFLLL